VGRKREGKVNPIPWHKLPLSLCLAFAIAHRPEDVVPALRMAETLNSFAGGQLTAYLDGCYFGEEWRKSFDEIRDSAQTYREEFKYVV
jgi:hypothetical protein